MSGANTFEIIKAVGFAVIDSNHHQFEFDGIDNEEYIPALRATIDAITKSAGLFVEESAQKELTLTLRAYALDLFVDLWLRDQADDDQGPVIEKKRAIKLFNQIYDEI